MSGFMFPGDKQGGCSPSYTGKNGQRSYVVFGVQKIAIDRCMVLSFSLFSFTTFPSQTLHIFHVHRTSQVNRSPIHDHVPDTRSLTRNPAMPHLVPE